MKIKVIVWQEDDIWCGSVPALPGCHTWGESYDRLMEMIKKAIEAWLEVATEKNFYIRNHGHSSAMSIHSIY
jgi:predicted RNase H-like HicB family nuclease